MSSTESGLRVSCPSCGSLLVTDDVVGGGDVICGRCRLSFVYQPSALARRLSRKAVASLALATAALVVWLTAVPAVVLGVLALVDIHRHENRLHGRRLAVAGIIISVVFGCLGFLLMLGWLFFRMEVINNPG